MLKVQEKELPVALGHGHGCLYISQANPPASRWRLFLPKSNNFGAPQLDQKGVASCQGQNANMGAEIVDKIEAMR